MGALRALGLGLRRPGAAAARRFVSRTAEVRARTGEGSYLHEMKVVGDAAAAPSGAGELQVAPVSTSAFHAQNATPRRATLVLEDGTRLTGTSFGYEKDVKGELVFQTGMTGYPETLTDPSYRGQMLVSTFPLVGNYGVPCTKALDEYGLPMHFESDSIHVAAYIVSDYSHYHSHWEAAMSLGEWLTKEKVPGIYGLDTRLLTKKIRDSGALKARIEFEQDIVLPAAQLGPETFEDPNERHLVAEVSTKAPVLYGEGNGGPRILAVDCGIKYNMIRHFLARGCEVKVVPWDYDFTHEEYDGLFISNGPGDPTLCGATIGHLKSILDGVGGPSVDKPLFGICLGNQLLALAAGAETYKLPFGNRGQNQPVINLLTNQCYITPQNHGYAINAEQLPDEWEPLFVNRNDGSNEGIMHATKPWFTAQFHPEAWAGPTDTEFLFDVFIDFTKKSHKSPREILGTWQSGLSAPRVAERVHPKKILLLGSGGLTIGQAGEFDYSGNQAIKALREEGSEVVLINPNIASVQTNPTKEGAMGADTVYFMPVTPKHVESIIQKEKPDGIILSMGGQTALNCGVEMDQAGIFDKYGVKVLGTSVDTIIMTEDRELFKQAADQVAPGKSAASLAVNSVSEAMDVASDIGYPVMIRSAFSLGGLGSGLCYSEDELHTMASKAFSKVPQILVERSLKGWKEVEYEVVRDAANNCITVCNMENFDPMGTHTGDSMVVAPSQTLSNAEYQILRNCAIDVVRHLGIIGECNIQYALDPHSRDFRIIEVNPRLSRSSALASKATGYPLAFVAAKLALGIELPDLRNSVTQSTTACFEPSLDYIVAKVPRWDLSKFDRVSRRIGSAMQSVGEVMGIGRNFEECFQKALRMVEPTQNMGFEPHESVFGPDTSVAVLEDELANPTDRRIFALAKAFKDGYTVDQLHELTRIDRWFLYKLQRIHETGERLEELSLDTLQQSSLSDAKKSGFSDVQIASRIDSTELDVRALRKQFNVLPVVKQIDTTAAETPAATNYLYCSYHGSESDVSFDDHGTMVLGSGSYRIGSSVEFDWCSVSCIRTLRKLGYKSVMVNSNPETVSTDYDECDKLYFDELSLERVLDIYEAEECASAIVSVGGQIPNGLSLPLEQNGVNVIGTTPTMIDTAEDRNKFSDLMDQWGIDQPKWASLTSEDAAFNFADAVGYPVLVRPSYVLSGAAMNVAYTPGELNKIVSKAEAVSSEYPIVISEFVEGAREIDVDAVANKGQVIAHSIAEHVENAGVHSGDATLVLPTQTISEADLAKCKDTIAKVAEALEISGPFNMQLLAKDGTIKIIETNLRASRSCPFSSKAIGTDLIEKATRVIVGADTPADDELYGPLVEPRLTLEAGPRPENFVAVKAPMFSFHRLSGADPSLGVEMSSTGEVGCFGVHKEEAFLKAMLSTGATAPVVGSKILVSIESSLREEFTPTLRKLSIMGYELCATEETAGALQELGLEVTHLHWPESGMQPNVDEAIRNKDLSMVMMFSNQLSVRRETNYAIRRLATDYNVPLITNLQVAEYFMNAIEATRAGKPLEDLSLQEYWELDGNVP